jgi:hypothetical protein
MTPSNVIYLSDRRDPWADDGDDTRWGEDYRDMWIAVLKLTVEDYWRGIRKGQHKKLAAIRLIHRGRRDAEEFRDWLDAANWLLSEDTTPRSCRWLLAIIRLDPATLLDRMKNPPVRVVPDIEEEEL